MTVCILIESLRNSHVNFAERQSNATVLDFKYNDRSASDYAILNRSDFFDTSSMTVFFWSLLRFLCWYQNAHQQYHKQMHFIWSNKKKLRRQNEIKPESVNWLIDFSQKVTYTIIALLFFCSSMSFSRLLYFGTLRPSVLPQSLKKIGVDSPCDLWWKEERALFPKCVAKPCVPWWRWSTRPEHCAVCTTSRWSNLANKTSSTTATNKYIISLLFADWFSSLTFRRSHSVFVPQ